MLCKSIIKLDYSVTCYHVDKRLVEQIRIEFRLNDDLNQIEFHFQPLRIYSDDSCIEGCRKKKLLVQKSRWLFYPINGI